MDSMSMSMNMPVSATSTGTVPSSTMGTHAQGGMGSGMDMGSSSMMSMSMMSMTFFTSTTTPLYSESWMPSSQGQYAGTCIFLIALSVLLRLLYGIKCQLEGYWHRQAIRQRYIIAAGPAPHQDSVVKVEESSREALVTAGGQTEGPRIGTLTVNGVSERVRVVQSTGLAGAIAARTPPFKLNIDLARACFVTAMVGVAYLLMLAIMTMNVGYFLSVLGGAFLGELLFGRWAVHSDFDHH